MRAMGKKDFIFYSDSPFFSFRGLGRGVREVTGGEGREKLRNMRFYV